MSSAFLAPKPKPSTSRTHFIRVISSKRSFPLISSILESTQAGCQSRQSELYWQKVLPGPPKSRRVRVCTERRGGSSSRPLKTDGSPCRILYGPMHIKEKGHASYRCEAN